VKRPRHARYGLLHPLELAFAPWQSVSMDFIVELPLSKGCSQIWVIVDRFTKMAHFIPLKDDAKKAPDLAPIFAKEIWKFHGLPTDIVSDRDTRFTSEFWSELCKYLGIKQRMSTFVPTGNRWANGKGKSNHRGVCPELLRL
jgi:transposase InsO family protein